MPSAVMLLAQHADTGLVRISVHGLEHVHRSATLSAALTILHLLLLVATYAQQRHVTCDINSTKRLGQKHHSDCSWTDSLAQAHPSHTSPLP